jgi:hypothetical protein
MWTVALFSYLTGLPKVALYLPGLLSAATTTGCCMTWAAPVEPAHRRIAALLFLATYQSYSILRTGQIDSFLCLWVALGLYGLLATCCWARPGPGSTGCAAMGLGIISKGVGFVPALMLLPYAWAVRKRWRGVVAMPGQGWRWSLGLLWLLAGCAVWLLPLLVSIAHGGGAAELAYLKEILLRQTANRYANAWDHREPFWYFFAKVIPKYWLPLVLALPWLVPAWRRQLQKRDGRLLVLLGWVALVLLFFSLSSGKRKLYIFPALPGLVLAIAPLLPWLLNAGSSAGRAGARCSPPSPWCGSACGSPAAWSSRSRRPQPARNLMAMPLKPPAAPNWCWSTGARALAVRPPADRAFRFRQPPSADTAAYWLRQHPCLRPAAGDRAGPLLQRRQGAQAGRYLARRVVCGRCRCRQRPMPATAPDHVYHFTWAATSGAPAAARHWCSPTPPAPCPGARSGGCHTTG